MCKSVWPAFRFATLVMLTTTVTWQAAGMGMESFGPVDEHEHIGHSGDWPNGVEQLLRHPARVYWQWVNGSERAYYDGDGESVNELLDLYSKIEMAEHPVAVLPGERVAKSFDGKSTPYIVEFDLPGKLELGARRMDGSSALYPRSPRLIVVVDTKRAERLDELRIPPNVTLQSTYVNVEPALTLAQDLDANPRIRCKALLALAELGGSSPQVPKVLKRAAADEDAAIRAAGEQALKRIADNNRSIDPALRERLRDFVKDRMERMEDNDSNASRGDETAVRTGRYR